NIYTSVWEEKPILHRTTPRIRQYREKTRPGAIIIQKEKQEEAKQAHLAQLALEKEMIATYMQNNVLDIQTLPTVPVFVRKMLLNWVGKAMSHKDHTFQTEHGHKVKMVLDDTKKMILLTERSEASSFGATCIRKRNDSNLYAKQCAGYTDITDCSCICTKDAP